MSRVGSEYRDTKRDRPQWALRQAFLSKVAALAPEVRRTLLGTVLPPYRKATNEGAIPRLWRWDRRRWEDLDPTTYPQTAALRSALLGWGERYHLTDDWLLDVALGTVWERHEWDKEIAERRLERKQWKQEMAQRRQNGLPWMPLMLGHRPPKPAGFADVPFADMEYVIPFAFGRQVGFSHAGWVPQWKRWTEYEALLSSAWNHTLAELHRAWADAVREYRQAREQEAKQRGMSLSPVKHETERHMEWLVRWQVLRQDRWEIARACGLTYRKRTDTIRDGIQEMARSIGLKNLRKGKRGRPPAI